ncbi:uncharacterized protein E0L32_002133 [Thyridium curvatum]|uniref:Xylanolytic transcriptional activator regulatory domain-containing protein n=1 Tax=Thyridium curvatum TaxID=1093900 RepID=A0A507ATJ5_9PEZI|nr:uncharacterized protein E0L32_002133 [Thyridium curvatum]TPX07530.1 hypothetical protein E0L32_002133 [Thyridium curvatum]
MAGPFNCVFCDRAFNRQACTRHRQPCTYSRIQQGDEASTGEDTSPQSDQQAMSVDNQTVSSGATPGQALDQIDFDFLEETAIDGGPDDLLLTWQEPGVDIAEDISTNNWSFMPTLSRQLRPAEKYRRPTHLDIVSLKQFPFLQRIADDIGIANTFECGTLEQRQRISITWRARRTSTNSVMAQLLWTEHRHIPYLDAHPPLDLNCASDNSFNFLTGFDPLQSHDLWSPAEYLVDSHGAQSATAAISCLNEDSTLFMTRGSEIVSLLHDTIATKHSPNIISTPWSESLEAMCSEFFGPDNIEKFLDLFWTFWKPNWPAIHKAGFDISSVSAKLLAAMAILGASLSPDTRDRAMAHLWLNPVEQLVFDDELFWQESCLAWDEPHTGPLRKAQLEILQAGFCVALYQTWEGSKESKRRIRRFRFSAVVSLARDIGFSSGSLRTVDTSSITTFDWEEYVLRESLIRVFHYVFALDSGLALFYRHPPRMVLSEAVMELASPEQCFEAQSAEECFVALKVWRDGLDGTEPTTISSALAAICTEKPTPGALRLFPKLSVLNMFTMVSGLYGMSFRLETSMMYGEEVSRVQAGLERWRELWPSADRDEELTKRSSLEYPPGHEVGFMKYAPEYWLFARLMLDRIRSGKVEDKVGVAKCEDTDMEQLHKMLQSFTAEEDKKAVVSTQVLDCGSVPVRVKFCRRIFFKMISALTQATAALPCPLYVVFLLSLVLYFAAWVIYTRYFHPLAKYPGPFLASISRLWLVIQITKANIDKTQRKLHEKYGPFVRVAPNEVVISDPEAVRVIYGINSGFTKTDFYLPWRPQCCKYPDSFTSLDEKEHASRRKIVNNLYSMSSISRSEDSIDLCTDTLLDKMNSFSESGEIIDMAQWAQMYAFDVIGQLFFSRMFGFLKAEHDHLGYIRSLDLLLPILTVSSVMPTYVRSFFLLGGAIFPRVLKALQSLGEVDKAADLCIAERQDLVEKGEDGEKKDILSSLFQVMHDKGEKVDFKLSEVKVEVYAALLRFAGSDTTAAAVSSILYHLMKNPSAYNTLVEEIDNATRAGDLSVPAIRYQEAIKLPYLDACCKEGMRLHPSVGYHLPRTVPQGGCSILGEWFPEGSRVGVNAAVIHFDRSIFGEDADEFRPERWFRPEAVKMDRYMFQFGGGSRTCIGKNISLCEMYKMIPQLLRSYHLELAEPDQQWSCHNYWFHKPSNVRTRIKARTVSQ